jgi:putative membrane protein
MLRKVMMAALLLLSTAGAGASAESPADLNDLEIAHVAYTADSIDIRYAHLALAISENPAIREFAKTMIRDHEAVNEQALALVAKLDVAPQDNFLSRQLGTQADQHREPGSEGPVRESPCDLQGSREARRDDGGVAR